MQHQDGRETLADTVAAWLLRGNVLEDAARRLVLLHEHRRRGHKFTGAVEIWEIPWDILVTVRAPHSRTGREVEEEWKAKLISGTISPEARILR